MNAESPAVKAHLDIMQGVIQRMAANSGACKTWCVSLVSAIVIVAADKGKPALTFVALLPTVMFFILDVYYLTFEKAFRKSYEVFVGKVHDESVGVGDLFAVKPAGRLDDHRCAAMRSLSTWGFYASLAALVLLARFVQE